jgi:GLPGLI family protein
VRQIENPDGVFYQQIKAWYCPEINYSFGPIGYYGLPGLILELQIDNVTYKAIRIKIDDSRKKLNIAMPKAEKIVSYNEYLNISKELYKKMTRKN